MPFDNIFFQVLIYSSLVFFNITMILAVVALINIITATSSLRQKTEFTMEKIYDSASNLGDAGSNIASFLAQFIIFKSKNNNPFGKRKWF